MLPANRSPSEVLKRGYSEEEISHIYELGKLFLENGAVRKAERIMSGITEVAPDFSFGWLGLAAVHHLLGNHEAALQAAQTGLKVDPSSVELSLFLITFLMHAGDYNTAGMHLGEVREKVESGLVDSPQLLRYYRAQYARFQVRGGA